MIHKFEKVSFKLDVLSRFKQTRLILHERSAWNWARTVHRIFPYLNKMHLLRKIRKLYVLQTPNEIAPLKSPDLPIREIPTFRVAKIYK